MGVYQERYDSRQGGWAKVKEIWMIGTSQRGRVVWALSKDVCSERWVEDAASTSCKSWHRETSYAQDGTAKRCQKRLVL